MKEERIRCLSCQLGSKQHEMTGETMHVNIQIELVDLPEKPCPDCGEKTLVKA